mgnify:CR=1 FL=1
MSVNEPEAAAAIISGGLGLLGRVMAMVQEKRSPFSRDLLWEIPTGIGTGWIGRGAGEYYHLDGFALFAASIVCAYLGPRFISWGVQKVTGYTSNGGK